MNLYYLDSSALVKRYYQEKGTRVVQWLFDTSPIVIASSLVLVEVVATLARKRKAKAISSLLFEQKVREVEEDWRGFIEVRFTSDVVTRAKELARDQALRGADAVHLASVLKVRDVVSRGAISICFVVSDEELKDAAAKKGFEVMDPEQAE